MSLCRVHDAYWSCRDGLSNRAVLRCCHEIGHQASLVGMYRHRVTPQLSSVRGDERLPIHYTAGIGVFQDQPLPADRSQALDDVSSSTSYHVG